MPVFDLWSLDEGRQLATYPDRAAALEDIRARCVLGGPLDLVLSEEDAAGRRAVAAGADVLALAGVPGGPWTEERFVHERRTAALAAVAAAADAFVRDGSPAARSALDRASRRMCHLGRAA